MLLKGVTQYMEISRLTKCDSNCVFLPNSTIEVTTRILSDGVVDFKSTSSDKLNFKVDDIVYLDAGYTAAKYKYYKITYVSFWKNKNIYEYTLSASKYECID
jgi:hypothetical protein